MWQWSFPGAEMAVGGERTHAVDPGECQTGCCARAATGHAAALPTRAMKCGAGSFEHLVGSR